EKANGTAVEQDVGASGIERSARNRLGRSTRILGTCAPTALCVARFQLSTIARSASRECRSDGIDGRRGTAAARPCAHDRIPRAIDAFACDAPLDRAVAARNM